MDGLKKLSEIINKNSSKTVMQINHAGSAANSRITRKKIVAFSVIENMRKNSNIPHELTKEEIQNIIKYFKEAAKNSCNSYWWNY